MRASAAVPRSLEPLLHGRRQLCHVKSLSRNKADLGHAGQHRAILARRRGGATHEARQHVEVGRGIHAEDHRLRTVGHAVARVRIDRWRLVRVGFAVGAERHDLVLGLQCIDRGVVRISAVGIGPAQDHHVARRALDLLHPGRNGAGPARACDQVVGCLATGGAHAGRIEIRHPEIGHLEQVEALAHVRVAEHLRLAEIEPCERVERVGIRRRDAAEVSRRITLDIDELAHRGMQALDLFDVRHLHPRDLGGDQRVAVDVGIKGDLLGLRLRRRRHLGDLGQRRTPSQNCKRSCHQRSRCEEASGGHVVPLRRSPQLLCREDRDMRQCGRRARKQRAAHNAHNEEADADV